MMYLNIKNRYKNDPERLIRTFKLYFNKIPSFESRLDEEYDPESFLFNFEEFKEEFRQILNIHSGCGVMCVHLARFYEKVHQINHSKKETVHLASAVIDQQSLGSIKKR